MQKLLVYIIAFTMLLLLQEFVLMHISTGSYMAVYIYIMLVVMAEMETPSWLLLLGGFAMGWTVDSIEGGAGLFAAATTWLAFVRPTVLQWLVGRDVTHTGGIPISSKIGSKKFITYTTVMVLLWTIPFFTLEALGSFSWIYTPVRIILSTIATTAIFYLLQLPLNRHK